MGKGVFPYNYGLHKGCAARKGMFFKHFSPEQSIKKNFPDLEQGIAFLKINMLLSQTSENYSLLYGGGYMHDRSSFKQMNLTCGI